MNLKVLKEVTSACIHFLASDDVPPRESLAAEGLAHTQIDGTTIRDATDLFKALESAFRFPYFGHNWDALDDVLRDLSWLGASGHVLVVRNATRAWSEAPETMGKLVESWLFVVDYWRDRGVPFHLVFDLAKR